MGLAMKFKFIKPQGPEYCAERMLRWEVLRKPLGMPPGSEALPEDELSLHLVALQEKNVVGCVCFHPETEIQGRIYQMAISEDYQGNGFGRKLIYTLENSLIKRGIREVYIYARQESEGFYQRMGYHPEEDLIKRLGVLHRTMRKAIVCEKSNAIVA